MDICSTRTMRVANCGTDHQMLRSRTIFSVRKKTQSERRYETEKLNTSKLRNTSHAESLVQQMDNILGQSWEHNNNNNNNVYLKFNIQTSSMDCTYKLIKYKKKHVNVQ